MKKKNDTTVKTTKLVAVSDVPVYFKARKDGKIVRDFNREIVKSAIYEATVSGLDSIDKATVKKLDLATLEAVITTCATALKNVRNDKLLVKDVKANMVSKLSSVYDLALSQKLFLSDKNGNKARWAIRTVNGDVKGMGSYDSYGKDEYSVITIFGLQPLTRTHKATDKVTPYSK